MVDASDLPPTLDVVDHALLRREMTVLRDRTTPHGAFRASLIRASSLLAAHALRGIGTREVEIETPLEPTTGHELAREVVLVPVLRAGLGLMDGFLALLPDARVGHVGVQRSHDTHLPQGYYERLPPGLPGASTFVLDPMLATGGSAVAALDRLRELGARDLSFVCLVAAPEGVRALAQSHPDVPVVTAALDRELDARAYIRPGLGDAGDRLYGTS
jgi:uracil phosphoribosyltransferase